MTTRCRSSALSICISLLVHVVLLAVVAYLSPRPAPAEHVADYVEVTIVSAPPEPSRVVEVPPPAAMPPPPPRAPEPLPRPRSRSRRDMARAPEAPPLDVAASEPAAADRSAETTAPVLAPAEPGTSTVATSPRSQRTGSLGTPLARGSSGAGIDSPQASGPYSESEVDERPRLLGDGRPTYPADALRMGIEGVVTLSLVVDFSGRVVDVRVARSAGHGFDEAATVAARGLRFTPARRRGAAVAVRVTWTCHFRLDE